MSTRDTITPDQVTLAALGFRVRISPGSNRAHLTRCANIWSGKTLCGRSILGWGSPDDGDEQAWARFSRCWHCERALGRRG